MTEGGIEDSNPSLDLLNVIIASIREVALIGREVKILVSDDLSSLAADSIVMIDIILHLEQRLGIEFYDEDLNEDNFATVNSLFELVAKYLQPQQHRD